MNPQLIYLFFSSDFFLFIRLLSQFKHHIISTLHTAFILMFVSVTFIACNQQKVMENKLGSDPIIQSVFSKKEISDLATIRLLVDNMVIAKTGETDTKQAYEKFIGYLAESKNAGDELTNKITLPHDSLIVIIAENPTLQEIWRIENYPPMKSFSINRDGKVIEFLKQLSIENSNYKAVLEGIEIAGDVSPTVISDFIKIPEHYNYDSEAEKLYATAILVILTNKSISIDDMYLQRAVEQIQSFNPDSALFWLDKAIAKHTSNPAVYANKAGIMIGKNKHTQALELINNCIGIAPENAEYWKIGGLLNDYLGNTNEATRCYKECIALYNSQLKSNSKQIIYTAKLNKALVLILNNQENEGRMLFEELLKEYPGDSTIEQLSKRKKEDFINDLSVKIK